MDPNLIPHVLLGRAGSEDHHFDVRERQATLFLTEEEMGVWVSKERALNINAHRNFGAFWLTREIIGSGGHKGKGPGHYLALTSSWNTARIHLIPTLSYILCEKFKIARYFPRPWGFEIKSPLTRDFDRTKNYMDPWAFIHIRTYRDVIDGFQYRGAWLDDVYGELPPYFLNRLDEQLSRHAGRVLLTDLRLDHK